MNQERLAILRLGHEFGVAAADLLAWAKEAVEWLDDAPLPDPEPPRKSGAQWSPERREAQSQRMRAQRASGNLRRGVAGEPTTPRAARDVPAGESWAFPEHRSQAEFPDGEAAPAAAIGRCVVCGKPSGKNETCGKTCFGIRLSQAVAARHAAYRQEREAIDGQGETGIDAAAQGPAGAPQRPAGADGRGETAQLRPSSQGGQIPGAGGSLIPRTPPSSAAALAHASPLRPPWLAALEGAYCDRTLVNGHCPHRRGANVAPSPDGTIICPLHGLRWDAATGRPAWLPLLAAKHG